MLVQLLQFVLNSLSGAGEADMKHLVRRRSRQLPEGHTFTWVCATALPQGWTLEMGEMR